MGALFVARVEKLINNFLMPKSDSELLNQITRCQRLAHGGPLPVSTAYEVADLLVKSVEELTRRGYQIRKTTRGLQLAPLATYILATGEAKTSQRLMEDVFFHLYDQEMKYIEIGHLALSRWYSSGVAALLKEWQVCKVSHQHRHLTFKTEEAATKVRGATS